MEQPSNKVLVYKHIKEPAQEILRYIDDRRKGIVKSLRTRWPKFNKQCMGGIEPNAIYTIAGISGCGKSAFVNSLETDLFDLNPRANFVVLSFSYEMLSSKQVGRKLSYRVKKTTTELYSGTEDPRAKLTEEDYEKLIKETEAIQQYPIYYVDSPGTVEEMRNTIIDFYKQPFVKGKWLIVILDHSLLVRGKTGEKEREILFNLQRLFMEFKKYGRNTIIQLSQMNREIEEKERILNPTVHFPVRRDLFASDSLYQASDYVIVLHRPEILGIKAYGLSNWPVENLIYMHFLKVREGEPKILVFYNNLKYNSIEEYNPSILKNQEK